VHAVDGRNVVGHCGEKRVKLGAGGYEKGNALQRVAHGAAVGDVVCWGSGAVQSKDGWV